MTLTPAASTNAPSVREPKPDYPKPPIPESKPEETTLATEIESNTSVEVDSSIDDDYKTGTVTVKVQETGDAAEDRYRLEDVMTLLMEYPGSDPAQLEIDTGVAIVRLDMPFTVKSGPVLKQRISELLGEEAVSLATV